MLFMYMMLVDEDDTESFEAIYKKYKNRAYSISLSILGDKHLADDATSEAFISLAKNFKIIMGLEYHKRDYYIVMICRNTAINILNKEKGYKLMVPYDDELLLTNDSLTVYDYNYLKECISKLSYEDKQVLYLHYYDGLNYKKIASTLGISAAAARKRSQYAKERLRRLLEEEEIDHE